MLIEPNVHDFVCTNSRTEPLVALLENVYGILRVKKQARPSNVGVCNRYVGMLGRVQRSGKRWTL